MEANRNSRETPFEYKLSHYPLLSVAEFYAWIETAVEKTEEKEKERKKEKAGGDRSQEVQRFSMVYREKSR